MSKFIIKLPCDGKYYFLEWSSVVDAPVTYGMSWEEFQEYYREQYGEVGMRHLPERMKRVDESGTSDAVNRKPVREWVEFNRAGVGEDALAFDEIVVEYIRQRGN